MVARYYAQFRLNPGRPGVEDEYSGVLELDTAANEVLEPGEIERLLGEALGLRKRNVELLDWSRLH
ncbi:MAG: hypothetical protein JJT85_11580 [Chromatiales bacterium]|nr:hypothetical protein [Chromatiales bacterium]